MIFNRCEPIFLGVLIISLLLGASCESRLSPSEVYDKYRSSVVLIKTSYYYETVLDNDMRFYYTLEGNEPIIFESEAEAVQNCNTSYGTGFFISKSGKVVTNRHVILSEYNLQALSAVINDFMQDLEIQILEDLNSKETEQSQTAEYYREYNEYMSYDSRLNLIQQFSEKEAEIVDLQELLNEIKFDPSRTQSRVIHHFLGVALDDTYVTSDDDYLPCILTNVATDVSVDLAVIQLKSKRTPQHIVHLLTPQSSHPDVTLGDEVFMIGFNHGIEIASTQSGIKSQFTGGTITQDPDPSKILYSIPTLPGSSGSPIIDNHGNLVAINFAKTGDFQGFSFGVPSKRLLELVSGENPSNDTQITPSSGDIVSTSEPDFQDIILSFVLAEQAQDFETISTFFSDDIKRYFDLRDPTLEQLKNRYEYLWKIVSNPKNDVRSIDKVNSLAFDMKTHFTYYNKKKQKEMSVHSTVRFLFDEHGKIVETYSLDD